MYQPNNNCIGFCNWMLNLSKQKLSGPQRVLVETIYNAAIAATPVSDQEWYNFNLFTPWRNKYYLVFSEYATFLAPALASGNILGYNLDGNANDTVGTNNGTSNNIVYSVAYGKIGQGALFNGSSSGIAFSGISSTLDFSFAVWLLPGAIPNSLYAVLSAGGAGNGIYYDPFSQKIGYFDGGLHAAPDVLSTISYNCVVITCLAGSLSIYVNGSLSVSGISVAAPFIMANLGGSLSIFTYAGQMDIPQFWDRALSADEAALYWNAGSGIQGPY